MNADELRALQQPLKSEYKENPASAQVTLSSTGQLNVARLVCGLDTHAGAIEAGLHPKAGGDGTLACSGDMLLEALVGCAGVTLSAVATAMSIEITEGSIAAEGDMDFRGTLGIDRETAIGFERIRLRFNLSSPAEQAQLEKLVQLTERYCVVYQTLRGGVEMSSELNLNPSK